MCLYSLNVIFFLLVLTFSEGASTHLGCILKSSSIFSCMSSPNKHPPDKLKYNSRPTTESAWRYFSPDGLKSIIWSSILSWGGFRVSAHDDAPESRCFNPADALPSSVLPSPNARSALESTLSFTLSLSLSLTHTHTHTHTLTHIHTPLTVSQPMMLHFFLTEVRFLYHNWFHLILYSKCTALVYP